MTIFKNLLNDSKKETKKTVLTSCLQAHTGVWASPATHSHVKTDIDEFDRVVYLGRHEGDDTFACYEDRYPNDVFFFKGIKGDEF